MKDYALKAPTQRIMENFLLKYELATQNEDELEPVYGLVFVYLGNFVKKEAVLDEEGNEVEPAVLSEEVHGDIRIYDDVEFLLNKLKNAKYSDIDLDENENLVSANTSNGINIFSKELISNPKHKFM